MKKLISTWLAPVILAGLFMLCIGTLAYVSSMNEERALSYRTEIDCWQTIEVLCVKATECAATPSVQGCMMRAHLDSEVCTNPAINTVPHEQFLKCQRNVLDMQCTDSLPDECRSMPGSK